MQGQLLFWIGLKLTWTLDLHHHQAPQPYYHQLPHLLALTYGLKMAFAMMKITAQLVNLMVEIAAIMICQTGIGIVVIVPVLLVMLQLVKLEYLTGLEIITAMMKTTMLCVDLMVAIVATIIGQIGIGIAMIVNAWVK